MSGAIPEDLVSSKSVYKSTANQVVIGALIENYSIFNLKYPTSDKANSATTYLNHVTDLASKSSKFFMADNGQSHGYGACGSMSWQIMMPNGEPFPLSAGSGRRLVVTYYVPF
jgi:hypothetical protein